MAKNARRRLPRLGATGAVAGLVAAMLGHDALDRVGSHVRTLAYGTFESGFQNGSAFYRLVHDVLEAITPTYTAALGLALVIVPLVIVARLVARNRVRAGGPDPLDRVRAWLASHRWATFVPAVAWTALVALVSSAGQRYVSTPLEGIATFIPGLVVAALGFFALTRAGLRGLTAPTIPEDDASAATMSVRDDEIAFSAVAVTPETRAAVLAVALVPQIVTVLVATMKLDPSVGWLVLAYVAAIAATIAAFSRASRIAVGIDGVLVKGTSRKRFYAYRDVDEARLQGSDLVLVRGGKVVLRLQLHGADAARADAVLARIRSKIARVAERRGRAEEGLVESASAEQIARAVAGAVDFRQPTLSREALWEIVEGPTVDADARAAAAKALVKTASDGEHGRLRVAAARCADPKLRVALEKIDEGEEVDEAETLARPALAVRP